MRLSATGRVTIPKHIRVAARVMPGTELAFSLEGNRIVITSLTAAVTEDRRARLQAAAARVRASLKPELRCLGANEIMAFLRGN